MGDEGGRGGTGGDGGVHQRHWSFLQEISATALAGSISQWGILLLSVSG